MNDSRPLNCHVHVLLLLNPLLGFVRSEGSGGGRQAEQTDAFFIFCLTAAQVPATLAFALSHPDKCGLSALPAIFLPRRFDSSMITGESLPLVLGGRSAFTHEGVFR